MTTSKVPLPDKSSLLSSSEDPHSRTLSSLSSPITRTLALSDPDDEEVPDKEKKLAEWHEK
jgi:hypothetical protein